MAGSITGDSRIINVTSNNISVSSEYRTTNTIGATDDIDYAYYNEYGVSKENVSYAGGIVGIIDVYSFTSEGEKQIEIEGMNENAKVSLLTVRGNVRIRGENVGGVIGYVGPFTYLKNALFEVEPTQTFGEYYQTIIGFNLAGGVVGENNGLIDHTRIEHTLKYQEDTIDITEARRTIGYQGLFIEQANYIGGLVGYNNQGTILNSYSRIDIVNNLAKYAGGLVGVNFGGSINKSYATGHIGIANVELDEQAIGGLIGVLSYKSLQAVDDEGESENKQLALNNAFAVNNWQLSAYNNVSLTGTYDVGETYDDTNGNEVYDSGETHTDAVKVWKEYDGEKICYKLK